MKVCHFREDFRQKNWRQKNGKSFTCLDQKLDCDLELIFSPFFCLQFFCLESFLLALSVWFRLGRPEDRRALPAAVAEASLPALGFFCWNRKIVICSREFLCQMPLHPNPVTAE